MTSHAPSGWGEVVFLAPGLPLWIAVVGRRAQQAQALPLLQPLIEPRNQEGARDKIGTQGWNMQFCR